jgi:flagellar assembly factor FliW
MVVWCFCLRFEYSMDVLSSMWENCTLSEKEDVEVQIGEDSADPIANRG